VFSVLVLSETLLRLAVKPQIEQTNVGGGLLICILRIYGIDNLVIVVDGEGWLVEKEMDSDDDDDDDEESNEKNQTSGMTWQI